MIIYLVRHGETAYNRDGLGLGRADVPLSPLGARQAALVGGRLARVGIERIYSSPLARALETARAIAGEGPVAVETIEALREMDVGKTEGLPFAEIRSRFPEFLSTWTSEEVAGVAMPGGESLDDVSTRIEPFLTELSMGSEDAVAVVSHNFVLRVALCLLLGIGPGGFRRVQVDLASVSTLEVVRGRVSVRDLNDTCHLSALNLDGGRVSV